MVDYETSDGLMMGLGLIILIATASFYNLMSIEFVENNLEPIASWLIVGGIIVAYFYSEREIGDLEDHEMGFTVGALGILLLYKYSTVIDQTFANNQPYSGLFMLLITLGAFYSLSTNMSITSTIMEMVVGALLLIAAMVEFNVGDVTILGDSISTYAIWIFGIGFFAAYVIAERNMGDFSDMEIIALVIAVVPFLAYEYTADFQNIVANNNPMAGVLLTVAVGAGYWIIKNDGHVIGG